MADTKSLLRKTSISRMSTWIKLDATGHGSLLNMNKYDIIHRLNIHARDLRILDPLLSYPSTILGRQNAIVINLEHIKAIITAKEVFLQDPTNEDVIPVVEELQRRLFVQGDEHDIEADGVNESQFEFRALEAVLESVCSYLSTHTTKLEMVTYPALDELTTKISSHNLDKVRKLKSTMTRLTTRVQKVREELEQLMDDDDNMANLYLSRKLEVVYSSSQMLSASGVANWFVSSSVTRSKLSNTEEINVEELEMLLEAYFMDIDRTFNKLTALRGYIDDTEDYINIQIDNHRNQLIQLELFLYRAEISLLSCTLVTGIFGMNFILSWKQAHDYLFKWVIICTGFFSIFMFLVIMNSSRKKVFLGSTNKKNQQVGEKFQSMESRIINIA